MAFFLSAKMLSLLLTQIDNLERAVALKTGVEGDAFVDGIRSVLSGFAKFLESQGVTVFVSVGSEVDPDRHDVMTEMPGEAGKIVQEFEKGYMLRDRVLRHAKVIV
jgi:molecular chaperone GrpE